MENMMAFLNEVTNENKLKQDITAIQSTVDVAVPMVKTQLKFLEEEADDFVDLNDEIENEIAMMRQLTTFDHYNDRADQENSEPIPEHVLGPESATVVEWVRDKRRRREKRAKRK
jgi:vacuolar-type H+-ATPase catalytic subunit A/Vma1